MYPVKDKNKTIKQTVRHSVSGLLGTYNNIARFGISNNYYQIPTVGKIFYYVVM